MTGYREHSFDPQAYEEPGRPLRPFNWVQWLGVAMASIGFVLFLLTAASRFGWLPGPFRVHSLISAILLLNGVALINSRRAEAHDPAPELAAQRKRWTVVIAIASIAVLGVAAIIEFTGA